MTTNVRATKWMLAAAPAIASKVAASRSWLARGAPRMLIAALSLTVLPAAQAAIPASERAVLVALYTQTGGASWTNKTGWSDPVTGALGPTTGFECTWHGVTCDAGPNHVIQIYLQNNNLVGTLPSWSALTALQYIVINYNTLTGGIPTLAGLTALTGVYVDHNQLTGSIPSLAGLTALQRFYVNNNQLTGAIPPLTGLSTLQEFEVENNQLTGSIPSLAGLTALRTFYADDNKLTGAIPSLTGLSALQEFDVGNNQLTGSVPSLTGLTALQSFYVYVNQLKGPMALPPSPSALLPGQSNLCGNQLQSTGNAAADQAWDVASGMTPAFGEPGWLACQGLVFGDQTVGTTSPPQAITLSATADTGTFTITNITISGDFAQTNACSAPITPGTSCTINVTFTPTAVGLRTGSLTASIRGSSSTLTGTISLQGTGVATTAVWVPVASHNSGLNQSQWRSDLGLLNLGSVTANVQLSFYGSGGVVTGTTYVPAGTQSILTDVVGQIGGSGSGAIAVFSDQPLVVTARSYNQVSSGATCYPNGTQGQDYPVLDAANGLFAGESAYLAGLTENASYHCNIGLVNTSTGSATVLVELFDGAGNKLPSYTVTPLAAGQWSQTTQPFKNVAGQTAMDRGYAKLTVQSGWGVFGFASVIDNITNDPTTVAMQTSAGAAAVPVASHNAGLNQSQWRSDLGLLNTGSVTANVQLSFYGSGGVVTNTVYVPAATQSILADVVAQIGGSGSGAIQIVSDQALQVTARSYHQVSSSASCYAGGTQGQDYPVLTASHGLSPGQSAYLAGLTENASYHCNIGVVELGSAAASVLVELFDGAGNRLTSYTVGLTLGQWAQVTQPFKNLAGQTAMDRGYARITVQSGGWVFGFASVIDNITNDPTTVTMQTVAAVSAPSSRHASAATRSLSLHTN